jgi:pimeloyl-ACP methyl ester carboxylesterase
MNDIPSTRSLDFRPGGGSMTSHSQQGTSSHSARHIVILIHGIRTFGAWQDRLAASLHRADPDIEVVVYKYGYFSALAFLLPFLRAVLVRRFRQCLADHADRWRDARVDIVAHSFGTYIAAWALRRLPETRRPAVHTVILCGSVLKQLFPWQASNGSQRLANRVINDCGLHDLWPRVALFTGLGMGSAGRHGLAGMTGVHVGIVNRYFPFGHSGFFDGDFMERHWVPLLTGNTTPVGSELVSPTPSWVTMLEQWADPVKLLIFATLVAAPVFWWQDQRRLLAEADARALSALQARISAELAAEQAHRRATQAELDKLKQAELRRQAEAAQHEAEEHGREEASSRLLAESHSWLYRAPTTALLRAMQAEKIHATPDATSAQASALMVMKKRREHQRLTAKQWAFGHSWFRPLEFLGSPVARLSPDGSHLLFATGGGADKGDPLGTVYLLNYDTLELTKLKPPESTDEPLRLHYFGFSSLGNKVYVTRGIDTVETYSLDGSFERAASVSGPKTYFSFADGVDQDRSILVGDTEGNLWLASASSRRLPEVVKRDHDVSTSKPLVRALPSPSGRVAALVQLELAPPADDSEQAPATSIGRASIVGIGKRGPKSPINLEHNGSVLDIAFSPRKEEDIVVTAGDDGLAIVSRIEKNKAHPVAVFDHNGKPVAFAAFSDSGDQVLTITDDGIARLWTVDSLQQPHGPESGR